MVAFTTFLIPTLATYTVKIPNLARVKVEPGLPKVTLLTDFDDDVLSSVGLRDTSAFSFGYRRSFGSGKSID
jgi:hypothetical protein